MTAKSKLKTPMAADRVSAELAKAIATLFPFALTPGVPANPDTTRREVEHVVMFTEAAEAILDLIDEAARDAVIDRALEVAKKYTEVGVDSLLDERKTFRKEQAINHLLLACLACQQHQDASHEAVERLRKEIKTTSALLARTAKVGPSKNADNIVSHHANRLRAAKPWLCESDNRTATEIADKVNADMRKDDLKKLGAKGGLSVSAIAKRIGRISRNSA